jgi:hypothetical protein
MCIYRDGSRSGAELADRLVTIRVLYREPDTMSLWGIPYEMRKAVGQQPRDIDIYHRRGWIWLGSPGWWGSLSAEEQLAVSAWLAALPEGCIPEGPCEWCSLAEWR